MGAEAFVDATIWYGAANRALAEHAVSGTTLQEAVGQGRVLVTTNLVVAEVHALLVHRVHRGAARLFLQKVRRSPNVVVYSTAELEERALGNWIDRYDDQDFSLADAVSFAVMAERGIEEALTLDRHFRVAGFRTRPAR